MAIGNLYDLSFYIDVAGNATQCTMGYIQTAGGNDHDTMEALCAAWLLNCETELRASLSNQASLARIRAEAVTGIDQIPGFIDFNGKIGTFISQALPSNITGLYHFGTNAPNAKHNGRLYVSGMPEGGQQEGTWDPSFVVVMQAFADKLEADLVTLSPQDAEFSPVVISRAVSGAPRVPPVGFFIGECTPRTSLRQQRRRKTDCFGLAF